MRKELITHEDPKSHVSEIFRTLRTNIQFMSTSKNLKTLLVTSTMPGEGKSWVATNLAIAFAQADKKVILIDADMRKCCLHNIFRVSPCPGLSNYLAGVGEFKQEKNNFKNCLRETEVHNLCLLPSGNVPPNPSELLATSKMDALLKELKKMCDIVIIDGTPSKLVTDAIILSRMVDSTIIVAGHNIAKKEDLAKLVRDIKNVEGNIAGVVYNQKPVLNKKGQETYYYASTPMKIENKKKQELEYEQKRKIQRNRATDMINRDRNPNKSQVNVAKKSVDTKSSKVTKPGVDLNYSVNLDKLPEERTAEMLKQFNDYLQQEKDNRDRKNRS